MDDTTQLSSPRVEGGKIVPTPLDNLIQVLLNKGIITQKDLDDTKAATADTLTAAATAIAGGLT